MNTDGTAAAATQHRIAWFVFAWNGQGAHVKMRHTANMRGTWGWDASCSCGWESATGGATKRSVQADVDNHKWDVDAAGQIAKLMAR